MKTRYYVGYEDCSNCAVYIIDGEHLAHYVPDAEWIDESSDCRKWTTASKKEARAVAERFKGYGATVKSYTVIR